MELKFRQCVQIFKNLPQCLETCPHWWQFRQPQAEILFKGISNFDILKLFISRNLIHFLHVYNHISRMLKIFGCFHVNQHSCTHPSTREIRCHLLMAEWVCGKCSANIRLTPTDSFVMHKATWCQIIYSLPAVTPWRNTMELKLPQNPLTARLSVTRNMSCGKGQVVIALRIIGRCEDAITPWGLAVHVHCFLTWLTASSLRLSTRRRLTLKIKTRHD